MAAAFFRSSSVFLVFFVAAVAALLLVTAEARSYGVTSLSESSCRFAQNLQSGTDLGDNRGPVVVGSSGVYYVGRDGTGSFSSSNLTLRTTTETRIDGLFSDLGNGRLWTFATSSSDWLDGRDLISTDRITHLIPLVADADGSLGTDGSRQVVALSTALNPYWEDAQPMVFLGMGEFVFASSIAAPSAFAGVFHVDIATGQVTRIHEMASGQSWATDPFAVESNNWAVSGVMERSGETIRLLAVCAEYAEDSGDTGGVYRYRIDGSLHSKLYTGFLEDAATFAVNYWSGDNNKRWFVQGENPPMTGEVPRIPGLNQSEWILSCAALHWADSGAATMSCAILANPLLGLCRLSAPCVEYCHVTLPWAQEACPEGCLDAAPTAGGWDSRKCYYCPCPQPPAFF